MSLPDSFKFILLFLVLISSQTIYAKNITIALGNFEPMFAHENQPSLFKDIIDGVFQYLPQYKVNYRYMVSNARLTVELNQKSVEGAANVFSAEEINGCLTDPVFRFTDVAITLRKNNHRISSVKELKDKSIVSYQRAEHLLGREFSQLVQANQYYQEVARPEEQAKLLTSELVDVSIGDIYIFLHSLKAWQKDNYQPNSLKVHAIFPPVYSSIGFNELSLCEDFNLALTKYKNSGQYQKTYNRFLESLGLKKELLELNSDKHH